MTRAYTAIDGQTVTREQIAAAFAAGLAVLVHSHGNGCTCTALAVDGQHYDTRNSVWSAWDAAWTTHPDSLQACIDAASN